MISRKASGARKGTLDNEFNALRASLNWAVKRGIIAKNGTLGTERPRDLNSRPARYYTQPELEAIYACAPYNWYYWRFLANTGLRLSEALQLRWENIKDGVIYVLSSETLGRTKSAQWRKVPVSPGAQYALNRFLRDLNGEYVFPRVNKKSLSRAFRRVLARAEIAEPKGSLHSLRHTFCSHLVMQGKPLRVVQQLAGHHSITVTEKYAHLAPDFLAGAVEDLEL